MTSEFVTGPRNRETPITSWDRGLVQGDPDTAIREIRELRARCVRAEEALQQLQDQLRTEMKKARGVEMHDATCSCNVCHWINTLAAVPEKDKP